jgi:M6 family metalloprotease-like protein
MSARTFVRGFLAAVFIAILAFSGLQPVGAQEAGAQSITGWLSIIWGDGPQGSDSIGPLYFITDESGTTTRLIVDENASLPAGGLLALNRQLVTVSGAASQPSAADRGPVFAAAWIEAKDSPERGSVTPSAVSGSKPFISIMCKFSDYAQEPKTLAYFQNMYGDPYPGLNHYWREISYGNINITGSNAVGWYTLPQPRSYYVYNNQLDFDRAATDCTGMANPYVNFAGFTGINLMFNSDLDGYAWGGGHYMTLDGVTKVWPMTWEPPWGYESITVMSHEMGHAFGLPHSSGNFGATYDNRWDVMSDTWSDCSRLSDATYGCLGQHTIMYHKDMLGWVPASMKYTLYSSTAPVESGMVPGAYLMATIPFGSLGYYYTVEARQRVGYDVKLPGVAIIIHEIEPNRSDGKPAHVVDLNDDGNKNNGDASAMWTVGETFTDATNGISVQVLSTTTNGFSVKLTNHSATATIEIDSNAQILMFGDVPLGYWAGSWIERLYNAGITGGCNVNPLLYCPATGVTRDQMAVFLLRGIHGSSYTPPSVGASTGFNDVPTTYWAAPWIKQLAAEGITGGCGGGNYCPSAPVTRDQMAVFLLRAKHTSSYTPPDVGSGTGFTDVPTTHWAAAWIKQLAAEGITGGCTATTYCPTVTVTRDQMAVFLVRTFNLP